MDGGLFDAFSNHRGADIVVGRTTCTQYQEPDAWSQQIRLLFPPKDRGVFPGCNFAATRRAFDRVGAFDSAVPRFAIEDTDWALRALHLGLRRVFVPAMQVDHPPRPSSMQAHLRRALDQRGTVRHVLKTRRPKALFGVTDTVQLLGLPSLLVFHQELPWLGPPLLVAMGLAAYIRAVSHLHLRTFSRKDAVLVLLHSLVLPWVKLVAVPWALVQKETWKGLRGGSNPYERFTGFSKNLVVTQYSPPISGQSAGVKASSRGGS